MHFPMNTARRLIPERILDTLRVSKYSCSVVGSLWGFGEGIRPVRCLICGSEARFTATGHPPRYGAQCPSCGSLERHRLLVLLDEREQLFQDKCVLHFAPEPTIKHRIKREASRYLTADLEGRRADVQLNIEAIDQPSETWDVVVASPVL